MKRTIFRRLMNNLVVILSVALVAGAFGLYSLVSTQKRSGKVIRQNLKVQEATRRITDNLLEASRAEKEFLLTGEEKYATAVENYVLAIKQGCWALYFFQTETGKKGTHEIVFLADEYCKGFRAVAQKIREKGSGDQGLNVSFKEKARSIEDAVKRIGQRQLMADLLTVRNYEKDYLLYGKVESLEKLKTAISSFQADVNRTPIEAALRSRLRRQIEDWWHVFTRLAVLDAGIERLRGIYSDAARQIESLVAQINAESKLWAEQTTDRTDRIFKQSFSIMTVLLLVCLAIGFSVTVFLVRKLSRPIVELSTAVQKVASGNLTSAVLIETDDEIEELGNNFNQMTRNLRASRREIEEYSRTLEQKVEKRTADLAEANMKLRETDRLKSQFLANMSHELRTPLNSIIGFSEILIDGLAGELAEEQTEFIGNIYASGKHLLNLINDILDLSKIEAGKMKFEFAEVAVRDLCEDVQTTVSALIDKKSQKLKIEVDNQVKSIWADEFKVKQVLLNLLSNASKFTPEGEQIEICCRPAKEPDRVVISVTDTGVGIKPEAQKIIFEAFHQADGSITREHGGTGLGLPISKKIVDAHGGVIWVESQPGKGSTFSFTLSAKKPEKAEKVQVESLKIEQTVVSSGEKLVMIVEDDPQSSDLLRFYFQQEGYKTVQIYNGSKVVEEAVRLQPTLITLDIMLPGKDGWTILQELKGTPNTRQIPVVIVSVLENRELGLSLGAVEYLNKPVRKDHLLSVLERLSLTTKVKTHGAKILVADDEPQVAEVIEEMLKPKGFTILKATDGKGALQMVQQENPDLLILDLFMPDVSGIEVVHTLRSDGKGKDIPILVLTGKEIDPEQRKQLNGQIQAFLKKASFSRKILLSEVRRLLSTNQQGCHESENSHIKKRSDNT